MNEWGRALFGIIVIIAAIFTTLVLALAFTMVVMGAIMAMFI